MDRPNIGKILSLIAFLGLAGFSCFWTAESLYIWQPSITIYGAWLIAIIFYIIASLCYSKMIKAFNKNADFYGKTGGRGGALALGIIGLLVFWIGLSLPTNTHTLLYRASIKKVIVDDIAKTQEYLGALQHNNIKINEENAKFDQKELTIKNLLTNLNTEIRDPSNQGIGPRFENYLSQLDTELSKGVANYSPIQRMKNNGSNLTQWNAAEQHYKQQVNARLDHLRAIRDKNIEDIKRTMNSSELIKINTKLTADKEKINTMDGTDHELIRNVINDLDMGYSFIASHENYIKFKNEQDRKHYCKEGAITEAQGMYSVFDVWKDFLTTDKYDDHGFFWWVMIALLVDLAAFIFFDLAFKKNDLA